MRNLIFILLLSFTGCAGDIVQPATNSVKDSVLCNRKDSLFLDMGRFGTTWFMIDSSAVIENCTVLHIKYEFHRDAKLDFGTIGLHNDNDVLIDTVVLHGEIKGEKDYYLNSSVKYKFLTIVSNERMYPVNRDDYLKIQINYQKIK